MRIYFHFGLRRLRYIAAHTRVHLPHYNGIHLVFDGLRLQLLQNSHVLVFFFFVLKSFLIKMCCSSIHTLKSSCSSFPPQLNHPLPIGTPNLCCRRRRVSRVSPPSADECLFLILVHASLFNVSSHCSSSCPVPMPLPISLSILCNGRKV